MQILFCRSNPIDPDPRVEKEARALISAGYQVQAIGWDRSADLPLVEEKDGIKIQRLAIKAKFGNGLGNLPALLAWQIGLMIWLLKKNKTYEIIHACDFDTILPALIAKFLFKKKVIYDIFDFYAAHLRRTPEWIKNLIRKVDYWAISKANAVILVDDARYEQIKGSAPKKIITIYNAPEDLPNIKLLNQKDPSASRKFHVAYIGLLQVERGLFEILEVFKVHPQWTLDMAGFGGDEKEISARCASMPNVNFLGRIPYESALQLSISADALFATYDPSIPNHRYSSPNKVFEAMMLGKPIIVCKDTNMDIMIQEADCGIVIPYGNVLALEKALQTLAENPTVRKKLGDNGRIIYETKYSWEIMKKRLLKLYSSIA